MKTLYRITNKWGKVLKLTENPKECVRFRSAVGLEKLDIRGKTIKSEWFHTLPIR